MENRPLNTGPKKFLIFSVLIAAFLIIVLILTLTAHGDNKKEITLSDFYNKIDNVAAVHFYGTTVYGIYKAETGEADTTKKIENFPKQYDFYITVAYSFQVENIQNAIEKYNLPTAEGGSDGKIQITAEPVKEG